jgi:hypothetical protein
VVSIHLIFAWAGIALAFSGGDLGDEAFAIADAAVEALACSTPISISTMLGQLACLGV